MLPPAELLEQALAAHGDALYRVALLLSADPRAAEQLLRRVAAAWREAPPLAPPDEPALIARLLAAANAEAARPARKQPFARPARFSPPSVPLVLHLLLSYDVARIARVLGVDEAAARAELIAAVAASAPASATSLPDRVSGELCHSVRATLADPASGSRHAAVVRGHLATCSLCRAWDQRWIEIVQATETTLRSALRDRTLPPALAARLVAAVRPARRRLSPSLRLALPPLAVLALIAALVLPGFLRPAVQVAERDLAATVEPQQLIERALARHSAPPDRGGIWYGRYSTQWYFNDNTFAPLSAEVWIDPRNPARHRLQLTHADGGAPYELQLGNGRNRLYYALDASYAPSIYGGLTTRARPDEPALIAEGLDAEGQRRALAERLAIGPWSIAPFYLRQAQAAGDLRVLGRQRDGDRTVQILSFSGISPLGLPPDAPGATAERVTVLLALDLADGLLRSATELAGPAGAEQTSRVTWRLEQEQWLVTADQISSAFDVGRAWTGMGDFSELGRYQSADLALPLISAFALGDPARLLDDFSNIGPFWMPATAPLGVDRALLLWPESDARNGNPPQGLVYLGAGRRLLITFNTFTSLDGAGVQVGSWTGFLRPGRGGRYTLALSRARDNTTVQTSFDPSANLLIDAYGFTRDELLAVVEQLRPFDLSSLAAQDELFAGRVGDPEARATLLQVVVDSLATSEGRVLFTRSQQFVRQGPRQPDLRADPYHASPYEGRPPETLVDEWITAGVAPARFLIVSDQATGTRLNSFYVDRTEAWSTTDTAGTLQRHDAMLSPVLFRFPLAASAALSMLSATGGELTMQRLPDGGTLLSRSEDASTSPRYGPLVSSQFSGEPYLYDLRPTTIITELQLTPAGEPESTRIYAAQLSGARDLVASSQLIERVELPIAEAPAAVRDGGPPAMAYVSDLRQARPNQGGTSGLGMVTLTLTETLALNPEQTLLLLDGAAPLFVEAGPPEGSYHGQGGCWTRPLAGGWRSG